MARKSQAAIEHVDPCAQIALFDPKDVPIDTGDRDSWCTPKWLWSIPLRAMERETYDYDPCTNNYSQVPATTRIMPPDDGLRCVPAPGSLIWMNPPYSDVHPWFEWATFVSRMYQCLVVGVVPLVPGIEAWKFFGPKEALSLGRVPFDAPPGVPTSSPSQEHCLPIWGEMEPMHYAAIKSCVIDVNGYGYSVSRI